MTQEYFVATGYVPRSVTETEGRQALERWLMQTARSGMLRNRPPFPPSPWRWSGEITPPRMITGAPARGPVIRDVEQRLWNFIQIECRTPSRPQGATKGWVTLVDIIEVPEQVTRGQPGGPFRPDEHPNESYRAMYYEAVRCLPENDQEALTWGYTFENRTQWEVILRECRRYNLTLRDRLLQCYSASRAHTSAVSSMSAQSTRLLWEFVVQLAQAALAAFAPGELPTPAFGDIAAGGGYQMRRGDTGSVRISHD